MQYTATSPQPKQKTAHDVDEELLSPRVLIVDDEPDTVFLLKQVFRKNGFDVIGATSGNEALEKAGRHQPDLALIDIMMPQMDGWETYRRMHAMAEVPVIMITARGSGREVVEGLRRGVEDYMVKPLDNAEVVERAKIALRRRGIRPEPYRLEFESIGLAVDLRRREVILNGKEVVLKAKEFEFVAVLARRYPEVVTYHDLSLGIWGKDYTSVMRKNINYAAFSVRNKFREASAQEDLIVNYAGWGYKLQARDEGKKSNN